MKCWVYVTYVVVRLARQWANEPNEPARLEMCISGPAFCSLAQQEAFCSLAQHTLRRIDREQF